MIEERVRVNRIKDGRIYIERIADGGCGGCKQKCFGSELQASNGYSNLPSFPSSMFGSDIAIGDELLLRMNNRTLINQCIVAYLRPVLFLVLFSGVGAFLSEKLSYHSDYLAIALGLFGLLISHVLSILTSKKDSGRYRELVIEKL